MTVYNGYRSPGDTSGFIRGNNLENTVMAGDFNTRVTWLGYEKNNKSGHEINETLEAEVGTSSVSNTSIE